MGFKKKSGLLVGAGFLLGTVGVKALTSTTAKKTGTIIYFLIYIFLWYVPDYNASRNISPTVG